MFPPSFILANILNMERLIIGQICLTNGHPRRSDFMMAQEIRRAQFDPGGRFHWLEGRVVSGLDADEVKRQAALGAIDPDF